MSLIQNLFDYESFMPHGYCFLWDPGLVWLHILSDLITALAYFSIPAFIYYIIYYGKKNVPYKWLFVLFCAFIFLCGLTHIVNILTLWYPYYWVQGVVKALTGVVSIVTAISLSVLLPSVVKILKK